MKMDEMNEAFERMTLEIYKHAMNSIYGGHFNRYDVKKIMFNYPATIVFWADGTKTVVKAQNNDVFDPEKGFAMAFMKKVLGNKGNYYNYVRETLDKKEA